MTAVIEQIISEFYSPALMTPDEVSRFPRRSACPVCAAPAPFDEILKIGYAEQDAYIWLSQCVDCHSLFYENPPSPEAIAAYYESVWNTGSGELGLDGKVSLKTKRRMAWLLDELGFVDKSASILDIGCGVGDLLAGCREAGFSDLWGTEMSRHRIAASEARFPGRIFHGGYEAVPEERRFDIIYCNHVLEHIREPADAFERMCKLSKDDGIIVMTVPDAWSEPVSGQVLFVPHLHSFCARSFEKLAERYGMDLRFWTADRAWELTAVFGRDLDRFSGIGKFRRYAEIERPKEGSLRDRICAPWQGPSEGPRYLAFAPVHKSRDPVLRLAGFRKLSAMERVASGAKLALYRATRNLGVARLFGLDNRYLGYIKIRPDREATKPLVVAVARPEAFLQMK